MTGDELGRRVRAAIGYSRKTDSEISRELGKEGPDTLRHWKRAGVPERNRLPLIEALARACGLPVSFFTADFSQLDALPSLDGSQRGAADEFTRLAREEGRQLDAPPDRRHEDDRRQGDRRRFG